jgi:hypothetical protein
MIEETIKNLYKESICDFFVKIKYIDVKNMPLINIPAIGCGYEKESVKIAIFGQDTNASNHKEFNMLKNDYDNDRKNWEEVYYYLIESFNSMTFFEYAEKGNFCGFVLKFLAEFYKEKLGFGWEGWKKLKNKENYSRFLQSFILGNMNSFEIDKEYKNKKKSESYGVSESDWAEVKAASESCFDAKLKDLIDNSKPDLLLIFDWSTLNLQDWLNKNYENKWSEEVNDKKNHFYCVHIKTQIINTIVYKLAHPTHMIKNKIMFSNKISQIIEDFNNRKSSIFI